MKEENKMPTAPLMQLPKSRSAEEFENMCADVLAIIYSSSFGRYGRQGQKQNGIDLVDSSAQPSHIVAQCKNYYACSYEKLKGQLKKDIASAGNLPFPIQTFVAMTSLDRDVETQNYIINIDADFEVIIFFWDDIQTEICRKTELLKKYYPHFGVDFRVPLECKNELISNANTLKQQAEILSCNYSNYKIAYQYNDDVAVYNQCVCIFNAALRLNQLHDQWYFQLKEERITTPIENLIKNMPSFHDENADGTGGAMVCTIMDFLSYFSDVDKKEKFISRCNKIIKRTEKL